MDEMTVQPALDDLYFELEDAARWFGRWCAKVDTADLMSLAGLDPPPGYAEVQESRLKGDKGVGDKHAAVAWHHFLLPLAREWSNHVLAVFLELRSPVLLPPGVKWYQWADLPTVCRIWLYEHREGQGWVCLDPRDDSHEAVRLVRERLVMEALG